MKNGQISVDFSSGQGWRDVFAGYGHQLDVMVRKQKQPVRPNRVEKATLALLSAQLKKNTKRTIRQLDEIIRILRPETVIRWHRELVRSKRSQPQKKKGGRPRIEQVTESLIVRLAKENLRWGYYRIEGELRKLGFVASLTTVRNVLDRHGMMPAPVRYGSVGWKTMMSHYKDQLLACDFFTVETIFLKTVYVLIFIELGTRRVHLAGVTTHPDGRWVAQQARQLLWQFEETETSFRCRIEITIRNTPRLLIAFSSHKICVSCPRPSRLPMPMLSRNVGYERFVRSALTTSC